MRRADWVVMTLAVGLGMGSLALIVAAFLASGTAANLLLTLGVAFAAGCLLWIGQLIHTVATRNPGPIAITPRGPSTSGMESPSAPLPSETTAPRITVYRAASAAPSVTELVTRASREVFAMVISGRNFFSPSLIDIVLQKLHDPRDRTVFHFLALNHFSNDDYLEARTAMMDMRRVSEFHPVYEHDFDTTREYAAQVTIEDPTRERFDIRFYNLLPTSYFYIVDDSLYLGALLSKPVASCPMLVIRPEDDDAQAVISAYKSHLNHYWNSSRFFVVLVGLADDGRTLLVRHRRRGLEWPTGFIEPNEDLAAGAAREFREETGYAVGEPRSLFTSEIGYYFVARIGERIDEGSAREVSEVILVTELPDRTRMSFPRDYNRFLVYLEKAREMLPSLPPPP